MTTPIICFGQQPCGFFPKRFLFAKFETARRLQKEIGGEIVFFLHDSDHDPRETRTILRRRSNDEPIQLNFSFENKNQRKFSPLYKKRIPAGWKDNTARQLPNYVEASMVDVFKKIEADNVADFCLEMYRGMGLLDGVKTVRSSDPEFRRAACDISEFFVDVTHESETVRARYDSDSLTLHEGGDAFVQLPMVPFTKEQISPTRDSRLVWMQSVVKCTHYIPGAGEQQYLNRNETPEVEFIVRDSVERSDEAYVGVP
ncbi:MAG: hypothetical protein K2X93_01130 [Candidatus Obscuribacterales bacterium]|nr:hypothetical protein [Candidatus Obscuribacterales bacterium]